MTLLLVGRTQFQCSSGAPARALVLFVVLLVASKASAFNHGPLLANLDGRSRCGSKRTRRLGKSHMGTSSDPEIERTTQQQLLYLLDQSVQLYSSPSLLVAMMNGDDLQKDIVNLRKREISNLVERIALTMRRLKDDRTTTTDESMTVQQRLDAVVMEAIQSEEKFDENLMTKVVELATHQHKLFQKQDVDIKSSIQHHSSVHPVSDAVLVPDSLSSLQVRLEQLQTLVSPTSAVRTNSVFSIKESAVAVENSFPIKESESSEQERKDLSDEVEELPNLQIEAGIETVAEAGRLLAAVELPPVHRALPIEVVNDEASIVAVTQNDSIVAEAPTRKQEIKKKKGSPMTVDATDSLAAALSAAAVGAAMVTKVPVVAAGVAFAPFLSTTFSSAVSWAKNFGDSTLSE